MDIIKYMTEKCGPGTWEIMWTTSHDRRFAVVDWMLGDADPREIIEIGKTWDGCLSLRLIGGRGGWMVTAHTAPDMAPDGTPGKEEVQ